jgi:Flp pilus assembly CpaE family ATPase
MWARQRQIRQTSSRLDDQQVGSCISDVPTRPALLGGAMPATDALADTADILEGHFVLILDNPRSMSAAFDVLRAQSAHRPHQSALADGAQRTGLGRV